MIKKLLCWVFPSLFKPSTKEKPPTLSEDDNLNSERNLQLIELITTNMKQEKIEEGYMVNQKVAFAFLQTTMYDELRKWTISRIEKIKKNLLDAKQEDVNKLQIKAKMLLAPFMHISEQAQKEKQRQAEEKARGEQTKRQNKEIDNKLEA